MSKNRSVLIWVIFVFLSISLLPLGKNLSFAQVDWNPEFPGGVPDAERATPGGTTPIPGGTTPQSITLKNPLGNKTIIQIVNDIIDWIIYISIPILALMVLWGGFQILTARGSPEKVKNGGKTIQWAVIGFAVILVSKGVALILLRILGG